MNRVFLIVLDGFGVGGASDAAFFGDEGADTLKSISKSKYFNIPNLLKMGLGNLTDYLPHEKNPTASFGRLEEVSLGKDTTTGHWEMAGVEILKPFPTYPDGFPKDLIDSFTRLTGRGVLLNKASEGLSAIENYGDEHVKSGDVIVYTSADSVFQIAAHEDVVPIEELYEICETARHLCTGEHAVGRVIARPFTGTSGNYTRTANRRDFSLAPIGETVLDKISESMDVIAVGKISDIFTARGITQSYHTHSNTDGIRTTIDIAKRNFKGLCFVNLVDFDMLYGHRRDIDGYAKALSEFDRFLPEIFENMDDGDCLVITGDHGCDPGFVKTTDHTRENVPVIIYSPIFGGVDLGKSKSFSNIAATIADVLNVDYDSDREGFYGKLVSNRP